MRAIVNLEVATVIRPLNQPGLPGLPDNRYSCFKIIKFSFLIFSLWSPMIWPSTSIPVRSFMIQSAITFPFRFFMIKSTVIILPNSFMIESTATVLVGIEKERYLQSLRKVAIGSLSLIFDIFWSREKPHNNMIRIQ